MNQKVRSHLVPGPLNLGLVLGRPWQPTWISKRVWQYGLTNSRDDDDGIEQGSGERPLQLVYVLIPVPAIELHLVQDVHLETLKTEKRLLFKQYPTLIIFSLTYH